MRIEQTRVVNPRRYLTGFDEGNLVRVCVPLAEVAQKRLEEIGLPENAPLGTRVLPARLGPISVFNAEGRYEPQTDQPMETAYRQTEWHWTEWHGHRRVRQSGIFDVPYKRYPRIFTPPPSVEVQLQKGATGDALLVTDPMTVSNDSPADIKHAINLFLELFGCCYLYGETLAPPAEAAVRRVNWEILPPGEYPWTRVRARLREIIDQQPPGNRPVIWSRIEAVAALPGREFVAIGRGGFRGYVIFAFPQQGYYICENIEYGNATYAFGEDWERLSQLTKKEILDGNLHEHRLVHRQGWALRLNDLFRRPLLDA